MTEDLLIVNLTLRHVSIFECSVFKLATLMKSSLWNNYFYFVKYLIVINTGSNFWKNFEKIHFFPTGNSAIPPPPLPPAHTDFLPFSPLSNLPLLHPTISYSSSSSAFSNSSFSSSSCFNYSPPPKIECLKQGHL